MKPNEMITLAAARQLLKSYQGAVGEKEFETACKLAIAKVTETTEWLHREATDEEILNKILAFLKEK